MCRVIFLFLARTVVPLSGTYLFSYCLERLTFILTAHAFFLSGEMGLGARRGGSVAVGFTHHTRTHSSSAAAPRAPAGTLLLERHWGRDDSWKQEVARSRDTEGQCGSFSSIPVRDFVYLSTTLGEKYIFKATESFRGQSSVVHRLWRMLCTLLTWYNTDETICLLIIPEFKDSGASHT